MPLWNESTSTLPLDALFKPKHACAVKEEVLKSWSLEMDYSRAPCLGADKMTRGLWERDCCISGFTAQCAISIYRIYGACLKWMLPELSFSDCWSRGTKLWERDWVFSNWDSNGSRSDCTPFYKNAISNVC